MGTMPIGNRDFTCGKMTELSKYPDYRNDAVLQALNDRGMYACNAIERFCYVFLFMYVCMYIRTNLKSMYVSMYVYVYL